MGSGVAPRIAPLRRMAERSRVVGDHPCKGLFMDLAGRRHNQANAPVPAPQAVPPGDGLKPPLPKKVACDAPSDGGADKRPYQAFIDCPHLITTRSSRYWLYEALDTASSMKGTQYYIKTPIPGAYHEVKVDKIDVKYLGQQGCDVEVYLTCTAMSFGSGSPTEKTQKDDESAAAEAAMTNVTRRFEHVFLDPLRVANKAQQTPAADRGQVRENDDAQGYREGSDPALYRINFHVR